jgi:hypothetical protein
LDILDDVIENLAAQVEELRRMNELGVRLDVFDINGFQNGTKYADTIMLWTDDPEVAKQFDFEKEEAFEPDFGEDEDGEEDEDEDVEFAEEGSGDDKTE